MEIYIRSQTGRKCSVLCDLADKITILEEMSKYHQLSTIKPKLYLKVYEDNVGAIETANNHKYRPRIKHLNIRLHHF